jgi:hypothetical protein
VVLNDKVNDKFGQANAVELRVLAGAGVPEQAGNVVISIQ